MLVLLLLGPGAVSQDEKKDADLKKMQGTWIIVKQQAGPRTLTKEELERNKPTLVIKENRFSVSLQGEEIDKGTIKLDSSQSPKRVDSESANGTKLKGVYAFKDGKMTVVFAPPGEPRPKAVAYEKGTKQILMVYQRKK